METMQKTMTQAWSFWVNVMRVSMIGNTAAMQWAKMRMGKGGNKNDKKQVPHIEPTNLTQMIHRAEVYVS